MSQETAAGKLNGVSDFRWLLAQGQSTTAPESATALGLVQFRGINSHLDPSAQFLGHSVAAIFGNAGKSMKILDPSEHTPFNIDDTGTRKFEAFLDRNFPNWRDNEEFTSHNAGTIKREWAVGIDDIERVALFRGQYVEIYDQYFEKQSDGEIGIHYPKNVLCDIDGDLTPVAEWGERKPDRQWETSLLPRYRTSMEQAYSAAVAQGIVDPIIVGFDVIHEYARVMAVEHFGESAVESIMQSARPGEHALLTAVLSHEQAERVLASLAGYKHIADIQAQGQVAVVFIRNGNTEWIGMPKPGEDPSES